MRTLALASLCAALAACGPARDGDDLFRVAAAGVEGGALLSVWGDDRVAGTAYIAGGYVGVDPAALGSVAAGRLVAYTRGAFRTVCTSDRVLWWVTGAYDAEGKLAVFATGEGGRIVRYYNGRCETLWRDPADPLTERTFWGAYATDTTSLYLVGGSALPSGARAVVASLRGETVMPAAGPTEFSSRNFYKIARAQSGDYLVVGERGAVFSITPTGLGAVSVSARSNDNRLFTVHCAKSDARCVAVGGSGTGLVLEGDARALSERTTGLDFLPGLNGVVVLDAQRAFVVGNNGSTAFLGAGNAVYVPPMAPTTNTLHGVGASGSVVIAVGGEFGVTTAAQRGVVLLRGDDSTRFTFDGSAFTPTGHERASLPDGTR